MLLYMRMILKIDVVGKASRGLPILPCERSIKKKTYIDSRKISPSIYIELIICSCFFTFPVIIHSLVTQLW